MPRPALAWLAAALAGAAGCLNTPTGIVNKPVETPATSPAAVEAAARLDQVGADLLGANPFLGVEPSFHLVGIPEPMILHPDLNGVMVSEGLVAKCKTDNALAAVVASELGQMAAERKTAARLKGASDGPPPDGRKMAAEVLRSAGYPESELATVAPLIEEATANRKLAPTFAPPPPAPKWSP